jgi:xanthine dehydrogenase accessory factor
VPAGLDLGSTTHAEIAVAILAELVQLRASGALPGALPGAGETAETAETAEPESTAGATEATDPVCGMTVAIGPGAISLEHDATTYYFCCAGCRRAFENDPAAYARAAR